MNLKKVLMELGNRLVLERKFDPSTVSGIETVGGASQGDVRPSTVPIRFFTEWLNNTPEAREILEEMGVDWPIVEGKRGEAT